MLPTPFPELNDVLHELVTRIETILNANFVGAYLQGSFAVGDFDQHSDVDFIVALEEELHADQVDALQGMHDQVYHLDSIWAKHLEGSYFPAETLREPQHSGEDLWYLDHGARSLIRSDHCNTLVVRWVVREKGIGLAGPPPQTLVDPIPRQLLRKEMFTTLTTWGQQILDDPDPYRNRFYQGFIVLNYCRMLHDILNGYPGSKRAGAEWAKSNLDPAWASLIDGAWDGRPDPARKVKEPADPAAFAETLRFVETIMNESRRLMENLDDAYGSK